MSVLANPELRKALKCVMNGEQLDSHHAIRAMEGIFDSNPDDSILVGGLLCALQARGLNTDLLCAAVDVLRERAVPAPSPSKRLVDCCGTGGDTKFSFNISTAAGIIAASAGAKVSKHGNRSVSSRCGSADVLAEIGVCLDHCAKVYEEAVNEIGFGFLYARLHHETLSRVAAIRHALGVPTLFNLIGPLLNPSNAPYQLVGTYSKENQKLLAASLQRLGRKRAWVVRAEDGMDELSVFCQNAVIEIDGDTVEKFILNPLDYGLNVDPGKFGEITADTPAKSAQLLWQSLYEADSAVGRIARLNAAAVLYISGVSESMDRAVETTELAQREGRSTTALKAYLALYK